MWPFPLPLPLPLPLPAPFPEPLTDPFSEPWSEPFSDPFSEPLGVNFPLPLFFPLMCSGGRSEGLPVPLPLWVLGGVPMGFVNGGKS